MNTLTRFSFAANNGLPATFDITTFLTNATETLKKWGSLFMILLGVILIIVAIVKIASGLISHGKKQVSWAVCIIMLILGGAFVAAGANSFDWVANIAAGGKKTIEDLGNGSGSTTNGTPTIIYGLRNLLP
jgi:uncharacterized membrane protein